MMNFEKLLKYSVFFGLISLLFTPFIVSNWLFFPYVTGKAYFFRVVVEIIFFLWLVLTTLNKKYLPKKSLLLYSLIIFLVSIFISNLIGENRIASFWSNFERMEGFVTIIHAFGLFLVAASVLREERDWKIIFNISLFASLILSILSIRQLLSDESIGRIDSTLGNPIYLAVYMLFHVFLALFYLLRSIFESTKDRNDKIIIISFYAFIFLLDIFVLFKTGTRGTILGLVAGISLSALLILMTNFKNKKVRIFSLISLIVITFLISSFFFMRNSNFIQNSETFGRLANISINEGTAEARLINWRIAWQGFKEKPIFGWGQSNFNLAFDKYYLPEIHGNETWFDRTHNIIFDWLIAGGIFGLAFYLFILFSAVYLIWKNRTTFNYIDKSIFIGLLAAFFIHNLFVFDQVISYIFFFLILAYIHSQNSLDTKWVNNQIVPVYKKYLPVIFIMTIPFVIYGVNYESYKANIELHDAMKIIIKVSALNGDSYSYYYEDGGLNKNLELFESAISRNTFANPEIRQQMLISLADIILNIQDKSAEEIKQRFIAKTIVELEKQINESKNDSRFPYLLGNLYSILGDESNSEKWLLETIRLSPKKQAMRVSLIRAYLRFGQKQKALDLAAETYNLDKSKDDIWFEYAKTVSVVDKVLFAKIVDEVIAENNTKRISILNEYSQNLNSN
jgi:O-antigen ligase